MTHISSVKRRGAEIWRDGLTWGEAMTAELCQCGDRGSDEGKSTPMIAEVSFNPYN